MFTFLKMFLTNTTALQPRFSHFNSLERLRFHKKAGELWNNLIPPVSHGSLMLLHHTGQILNTQRPHIDWPPQKACSITLEDQREKREQTNNRHAACMKAKADYWGFPTSKVNQGWTRPHPHIKRTLAFRCFVGWTKVTTFGIFLCVLQSSSCLYQTCDSCCIKVRGLSLHPAELEDDKPLYFILLCVCEYGRS